ncbi:hypothetical protein ACFPJ1_20385 [Kribbella qitaiheensis]|uniref:hypothetical protein n=1 Tax=Kribbella qitaiheensis TaxID=1544730 RepID=UPI00360FF8EC
MRLRRRMTAPMPEIDPFMGDPTARMLCEALTERDWPMARDILVRAEHPDDRAFFLEVCGSAPGVQNWIGHLAADDPLAQLVRGCHAVAWAWRARGGYGAQYTRDEQFRLFFERLRIAETCLDDVIARTPDEVTAWAFLVRTARGLQLPLEDGEFRFRQAIERHPTNLKAHGEWMQTLCKKWSGSHEWMHHFARDAAARGSDGSMLHSLVVLAHLEQMIDLEGAAAEHYMARADVRADLRTAAGLSIWHPAAEFRPGWPVYFNTFAVAFSQSGDLSAATPVFQRLGDNITDHPWDYLPGNNAKLFSAARAQALAATR